MKRFEFKKMMAALAFFLLTVAASGAFASWQMNGNIIALDLEPLSADNRYESVSDGAGGAIIVWMQVMASDTDIYAQRIDASGKEMWTPGGVVVCAATDVQQWPRLAFDGAGGAIVVWTDYRNQTPQDQCDVYAQHLDGTGTALWAPDGIPVAMGTGNQHSPRPVPDGAGGAILVYSYYPYPFGSNDDLYAARLSGTGAILWLWAPVCTASGFQWHAQIMADGFGGVVITWYDKRSGTWDIYAQRVNGSGAMQWTTNGEPVCTASNIQSGPQLASDGSGGAIIAWSDYRSGSSYDIYAQHLDSGGAPLWTPDGLGICTLSEYQAGPHCVSDGAGGAIIEWVDCRNGSDHDIYAQRIDGPGTTMWGANGLAICTIDGDQTRVNICPDGSGGIFVTWQDSRRDSEFDIYAARVDGLGASLWADGGIPICTAPSAQDFPEIIAVGYEQAIVVWGDARRGSEYDLYAQLLDAYGSAYPSPWIDFVADVPHDQGGWVRTQFNRSGRDLSNEVALPISNYGIWRRVDDAALVATLKTASSATQGKRAGAVPELGGIMATTFQNNRYVQSPPVIAASIFPPGTWEWVGNVPAVQQDTYVAAVPTVADSSSTGPKYTVLVITAHTTTPTIWYISQPDSGYSVDNIAPGVPTSFSAAYLAGSVTLDWDDAPEADFQFYRIYRNTDPEFVPSPANLVQETAASAWTDLTANPWGYYYKITVLDHAGNESEAASPTEVTGVQNGAVPARTVLLGAVPNPFNPSTKLSFEMAAAGHARLKVYDTGGRLVATLLDERRNAGRHHVIWDGRDNAGRMSSAGVYLYRLETDGYNETKRMVLIK